VRSLAFANAAWQGSHNCAHLIGFARICVV